MDHPEATPSSEPATDEELKTLYELAESWLMRHGTNSHSLGPSILGWHDGVAITDEQPLFSYLITEPEARAISDDAAETLRFGGNLEMSFGNECYIRNAAEPEGIQYEHPILTFRLKRPSDEPIAATSLSIEMRDRNPVTYRSEEESDKLPKLPVRSLENVWTDLMERVRLEHETGYDQMTKDEVAALRTLLEGVIANPPIQRPTA